jgi:hypothetical protein
VDLWVQVVERADAVALREELARGVRSDEPRAAGNKRSSSHFASSAMSVARPRYPGILG